jgi:hypothetical protein
MVLNVELINDLLEGKGLEELKEEAAKLREKTDRRKATIKEEQEYLREELKLYSSILEKINLIQEEKKKKEEKKEENEPLTRQQIKEINIDDLLKINNIFSYSKHWQMSEDDRDKFKIIKITNNFIMAKKLKKIKTEHLGGSGGYAYYKCILRDRRDDEPLHHQEKPFLRISKNKLDSSYFFKDGLRYELNKEFDYTEDNGR